MTTDAETAPEPTWERVWKWPNRPVEKKQAVRPKVLLMLLGVLMIFSPGLALEMSVALASMMSGDLALAIDGFRDPIILLSTLIGVALVIWCEPMMVITLVMVGIFLIGVEIYARIEAKSTSGETVEWMPPEPENVGPEAAPDETGTAVVDTGELPDDIEPHGTFGRLKPWGEKQEGERRILIVGDSFIAGDGLSTIQDVWAVKFKRMVDAKYDRVSTYCYGFNGWSTESELRYIKEKGLAMKPDLILIGYVTNDPDMSLIPQKLLDYHWRYHLFRYWQIGFPYSHHMVFGRVNNIIEQKNRDYGYGNWENRLWEAENMAHYTKCLEELKQMSVDTGIPVRIIFTMGRPAMQAHQRFDIVIPIFDELGIPHFSCAPAIEEKLGDVPPRALWSNPGNPHPGPRLTHVMAEATMGHLEEQGILQALQAEAEAEAGISPPEETGEETDTQVPE